MLQPNTNIALRGVGEGHDIDIELTFNSFSY